MGLGLGLSGVLGGASTGASLGSAIPGLGTAVGGIVGGGLGLLGGLFSGSGSSRKDQEKLMKKAWEYEKEGMGMQYQYGQQAADEAQRRNLEMWNATNYEAQRQHMEDAGLSPALMYGGGGQSATSQGGAATQPSGMTINPATMALQLKGLQLQEDAQKSQIAMNYANAAKLNAEASKTTGVDTEKTIAETKLRDSETKLNKIAYDLKNENFLNDVNKNTAEAQQAIVEWNKAALQLNWDTETYSTRLKGAIQQYNNLVTEGALNIAKKDLTYRQAKKVEKEVQYFFYQCYTDRMKAIAAGDSAQAMKGMAEAAKKNADNLADKIAKEYEIAGKKLDIEEERLLKDWIYGGIDSAKDIVKTILEAMPQKQAVEVIKSFTEKGSGWSETTTKKYKE